MAKAKKESAVVLEEDMADPRLYEFCILYPYPMGQKEESQLIKSIENLFSEAGGTQVAKDAWGQRGLAYTIGGYNEGNYVVYYYELLPSAVKELDRQLRIEPGVLRHIIVKPPKNYQIVEYSKQYGEWLKEREQQEEERAREKEERMKKKMIERQKIEAKRGSKKKDESEKKVEPAEEKDIAADIDKLIDSDDLAL